MEKNIDPGGYFTIKDEEWLLNQRHAGKVLSATHQLVKSKVVDGITSTDLNLIGEQFMLSHEGCTPTFKGYNGFPAAMCISINEELVHGIPSKDKFLKIGDIVKIDAGVTYKGAIADSAITTVVGEYADTKYKYLVEGCKKCLDNVILYINENISNIRLGDVGFFIKKEGARIGANIIKELTGHGLEYNDPHWFPLVLNYGERNKGVKIIPNTTLCIEPMFIYGSTKLNIQKDGWTITTQDIGAHWEHTIFTHKDRVEIIT